MLELKYFRSAWLKCWEWTKLRVKICLFVCFFNERFGEWLWCGINFWWLLQVYLICYIIIWTNYILSPWTLDVVAKCPVDLGCNTQAQGRPSPQICLAPLPLFLHFSLSLPLFLCGFFILGFIMVCLHNFWAKKIISCPLLTWPTKAFSPCPQAVWCK